MSDPINDGGSIQPRLVRFGDVIEPQGGMSLRDWFAGTALQGYLAGRNNNPDRETLHDKAAESCYRYADAMLATRTKGGQDE